MLTTHGNAYQRTAEQGHASVQQKSITLAHCAICYITASEQKGV